jgi:hypothetical protein
MGRVCSVRKKKDLAPPQKKRQTTRVYIASGVSSPPTPPLSLPQTTLFKRESVRDSKSAHWFESS